MLDYFVSLMADYEFCRDFWANFFSDLLVGAFLGTLLALAISILLSRSERKQQRIDEARARVDRAIRLLGILRDEIDKLNVTIEPVMDTLKAGTFEGYVARVDTPFWDIVQSSGELPGLLDNLDLLRSLTLFYDNLAGAKRAMSWAMESLLNLPEGLWATYDRKSLIDLALERLEEAKAQGRSLVEQIDPEIAKLEEQLSKLACRPPISCKVKG